MHYHKYVCHKRSVWLHMKEHLDTTPLLKKKLWTDFSKKILKRKFRKKIENIIKAVFLLTKHSFWSDLQNPWTSNCRLSDKTHYMSRFILEIYRPHSQILEMSDTKKG